MTPVRTEHNYPALPTSWTPADIRFSDGPVVAELLGPLMNWVEQGVSPGMLAGAHTPRPAREQAQGAGRPAIARAAALPLSLCRPLSRHRDVRDAANWVQGPARPAPIARIADWLGRNFYTPVSLKWSYASTTSLACRRTP